MIHGYYIGQRVIINGEIGVVCEGGGRDPTGSPIDERTPAGSMWIFVGSRGYPSCYDVRGVKPLPGGQL